MSRPRYLTSRTCGLEALAFADLARHEHVGEELHLDLDLALALARLAAAAGDVEREMAGGQPARLGVLGRREQLADRIERLEVGDRVGSRRAADRRLVHQHHVGDELRAFELPVRPDAAIPVPLRALQRRVEHVVHERALARPADAGDAGQHAERDLDVDAPSGCAPTAPSTFSRWFDGRRRIAGTGIASSSRRYLAVSERGSCISCVERAAEDDAPALLAGAQPHVHDDVGDPDHVGVVLDDEDGVALVAQLAQDRDEPLVVARVQADRRLVEHVERIRPAPIRARSPG